MTPRPWLIVPFVVSAMTPRLSAAEPDSALQALIQEAWELRLREEPLFATQAGDHRYDDRLPSDAPADLERQAVFTRGLLERLGKLDRARLSTADRISYDMLVRELGDGLEEHEFGVHRMPINADSGFHTGFAGLPRDASRSTASRTTRTTSRACARSPPTSQPADRQHARGAAHGVHAAQGGAGGLRRHHPRPRRGRSGAERVLRPPARLPGRRCPEAERARLRAGGPGGGRPRPSPATATFLDFMTSEYMPGRAGHRRAPRSCRAAGSTTRTCVQALHHPRRHARGGARASAWRRWRGSGRRWRR